MKKYFGILTVILGLLICLSSCSFHPDFPIGSNSDYEEIHHWGKNLLYKGKGYYTVKYCPTGVYKEQNTSVSFEIMDDGELYFDKHTYKSGLISVEGVVYNAYYSGSHVTVKKGDSVTVRVKMNPYFTTKKGEKFYSFSIYLAD